MTLIEKSTVSGIFILTFLYLKLVRLPRTQCRAENSTLFNGQVWIPKATLDVRQGMRERGRKFVGQQSLGLWDCSDEGRRGSSRIQHRWVTVSSDPQLQGTCLHLLKSVQGRPANDSQSSALTLVECQGLLTPLLYVLAWVETQLTNRHTLLSCLLPVCTGETG